MNKCEDYFKIEKIAFKEIKCSDWNTVLDFASFSNGKKEKKHTLLIFNLIG